MRLVVALGGNALLKKGEPMTAENQRRNVAVACDQLARVALDHQLVVSHGNGPQVGLLAMQSASYKEVPAHPLDVLDAETQGMIGYMVEQELGNRLPFLYPIATLLTMIEVDPNDPAFDRPTKPIGRVYPPDEASALGDRYGWSFVEVDDGMRRVVPSPRPKQIFELRQVQWLLERGCVVICSGGGGIPTMYDEHGNLVGVEAVIDKDHASSLLAEGVEADVLVVATDADAAYIDWGSPDARPIGRAHPTALRALAHEFPEGSMLPKVIAACDFAERTGNPAVIGALRDIEELVAGDAGTVVTTSADGITFRSGGET